MKQLLVVFLISISLAGFAQQSVETINGKKYFVHYVEKKQTLYGIHKKFNVPIEEITAANEGIDNGLQVGQKLLVPVSYDNKKYYQKHVVLKGETLYRIAAKYNTSVPVLKNINPSLKESDIAIGQIIILPKQNESSEIEEVKEVLLDDPEVTAKKDLSTFKEDTLVEHVVLAHETLYAIAKRYMVTPDDIRKLNKKSVENLKVGDVIIVPVKKVNYDINANLVDTNFIFSPKPIGSKEIIKKPVYKIALLLPLMTEVNKSYMNKPIKIGELEKLYPITAIAADFYHGFLLAADSLSKAGLNAQIYVYDTKRDTTVVKSILKKSEFTDMDMIVGPFFSGSIDIVANYCKIHKVPMVLPVNTTNQVLYRNPFIYKTTGSHMSQMDGMVDYIVDSYSPYHIAIVKPNLDSDMALYEHTKLRYNAAVKKPGTNSATLVEINMVSSSGKEFNYKLRKDTVNIVIVPSTDVTFVTSVFTQLNNFLNSNTYAKNLKVIVCGLEDWNKIDDIDMKHRMRTQQHYASYRFLNEDSNEVNNLNIVYRKKYGIDPTVSGVQGFDIGYYFLSALYLYGENFDNYLAQHQLDLVQNNFEFSAVTPMDGKENIAVCIIAYKNYNLEFISW
ncbi:amino acid ABC transporter substrate-binding protein [Putridiphycobacter roseus]|nr:LysM peptidoglycan-binding domain-containing protein [Putridiphycobacter roseus]